MIRRARVTRYLPKRPLLRGWAASTLTLLIPTVAWAGDYDRNDVSARELAIMPFVSAADIDPGLAGPCTPGKASICQHVVQPMGLLLRGTARRHLRQFYGSGEVLIGATAPTDGFSAGPWIGGGAAIGLESATDGFRKMRWYGELGADLAFTNTTLGDLLNFFLEGGMRFQVQQFDRPHVYLHLGMRISNNFRHFGYGLASGIGWTFD